MYEELWIRFKCPKCSIYGWLYQGDIEDLTLFDAEAIRCWNCKHAWARDPDSEMSQEDIEEMAEENNKDPQA